MTSCLFHYSSAKRLVIFYARTSSDFPPTGLPSARTARHLMLCAAGLLSFKLKQVPAPHPNLSLFRSVSFIELTTASACDRVRISDFILIFVSLEYKSLVQSKYLPSE